MKKSLVVAIASLVLVYAGFLLGKSSIAYKMQSMSKENSSTQAYRVLNNSFVVYAGRRHYWITVAEVHGEINVICDIDATPYRRYFNKLFCLSNFPRFVALAKYEDERVIDWRANAKWEGDRISFTTVEADRVSFKVDEL